MRFGREMDMRGAEYGMDAASVGQPCVNEAYVQNHFPIGQPEYLASRSLREVKAARKDLSRGAQPGVRRVRTSSSATRMSLMLLSWETRRRTLKAFSGSMV